MRHNLVKNEHRNFSSSTKVIQLIVVWLHCKQELLVANATWLFCGAANI